MSIYTPEERRKIQEKWIVRMDLWKNSGLSGSAWCKQEKIPYHRFIYWKKRLLDVSPPKYDAQSFIELGDFSDFTGIEIVIDEVAIRLSKDFDSATLVRCLKTLKESKC